MQWTLTALEIRTFLRFVRVRSIMCMMYGQLGHTVECLPVAVQRFTHLRSVPQELKDGVEAYLAQCASGPVTDESNYRKLQEVWELLPAEPGAEYVRPAESSEEALAAMEQLKAWSDASADGITKMVELMKLHAGSPGAQEAGLVRLGGLYGDAREGAAAQGLVAAKTMPAIDLAMKGHLADPEVQRAGCAALRGVAMAEGQMPACCDAGGVQLAVEAVRTHFKNKEVVSAGNGAFWAMAKAAGKNSPELSVMRHADVVGVLKKCMDHHAWDQTLVGRIRVTLPFITED